jgi:beta-lactamase superfamily II metal-dependent hydrolase
MKRTGFLCLIFPAFIWLTDTHAQTLRIYHIDVDQGDATLFISPDGHTLLVDIGNNGDGDELRAAMQAAGVLQLQYYITMSLWRLLVNY